MDNNSKAETGGSAGWWGALAAAVVALVVYGLTGCRDLFPGESAAVVAQGSGLFPLLTPDRPIWNHLVSLVVRFWGGAGVAWLSAVCGALAVGLVYSLSAVTVQLVSFTADSRDRARGFGILAGAVSAIAVAFAAPVWVTATRAHPALFHVTLLLAAARLLAAYALSGRLRVLLGFMLLFGLGTVESATFIVFAPLALGGVVAAMWSRGHLRAGPVAAALGAGLLGLCLYILTAWWFSGSVGYGLRGYKGFWEIVWYMWRDQYLLIASSLPREGWLVVLLLTGGPWLAMLSLLRRALNEDADGAQVTLHGVLTGIVLMVLLNLRFAPWVQLGYARLLVMPYVLTALVAGYLAVYWVRWWIEAAAIESPWRRRARRAAAVLLTAVVAAGAAAGPVLNAARVRTAGLQGVQDCMEAILDQAAAVDGGPVWLITTGPFDDLLRVGAAARGIDLRLVNLQGSSNEQYMRYVASLFDAPRLRNLARIGMSPLQEELFGRRGFDARQLLLMAAPDLWLLRGAEPVPAGLVFRALPDGEAPDLDRVLAEHQALWARVSPPLQAALERTDMGDPLRFGAAFLLRHLSMVGNNLGVLLEDRGRAPDAFAVYEECRRLCPDNLSALLNQLRLTRDAMPAEAERIRLAFDQYRLEHPNPQGILALASTFGYVREPRALTGIARTWALAGQPRLAESALRKALDLAPEESREGIRRDLAGLYLSRQQDGQSETLFFEILAENPENTQALLGLARIEARRGNFEKAAGLLERAEAAGAPADALTLERAALAILRGVPAEARTALEAMVGRAPENIAAWTMLCRVLVQQEDVEGVRKAAERLRLLPGGQSLAAEMEAVLALRDADTARARRRFREALQTRPGDVALLERVLRVEMACGEPGAAYEYAQQLLRFDAGNALGNHVIGIRELNMGHLDLAEDALRRSLETRETPEVMNDLAWVLFERGRLEEAERYARAAVAAAPRLFLAFATRGVILRRRGDLAGADQALDEALSLAPGVPETLLHKAELRIAQQRMGEARELMALVEAQRGRLGRDGADLLEELRRRLQ